MSPKRQELVSLDQRAFLIMTLGELLLLLQGRVTFTLPIVFAATQGLS